MSSKSTPPDCKRMSASHAAWGHWLPCGVTALALFLAAIALRLCRALSSTHSLDDKMNCGMRLHIKIACTRNACARIAERSTPL